jgi:hypothetical protein
LHDHHLVAISTATASIDHSITPVQETTTDQDQPGGRLPSVDRVSAGHTSGLCGPVADQGRWTWRLLLYAECERPLEWAGRDRCVAHGRRTYVDGHQGRGTRVV